MTETVLTLAEDLDFMPQTDLSTAEENCKGREWTSVWWVFTPEPLKSVTSLGFFLLTLSRNSHNLHRTLLAWVVTYTCKTKKPKFQLWPFWFNNIYWGSLLDHYIHCGLDVYIYIYIYIYMCVCVCSYYHNNIRLEMLVMRQSTQHPQPPFCKGVLQIQKLWSLLRIKAIQVIISLE